MTDTNRRVRVLHVITRLIRGGADENTVYTVLGMSESRWESDIVAGEGSDVSAFPERIRQVTRIEPTLVRDPHPVKDVVALIRLIRIMRAGRYDIVHTHTAKAGFLGRLAARLAGVPHIVHTLHGVTFHDHVPGFWRRLYVALERRAARWCDVMISVGEDVRRKYLEEAIGRREQYVTIPSGMNTQPFSEAREHPETSRNPVRAEFGLTDDDLVLGMVSRLEARKGWRYFLEAIARLAPDFPHVKAMIVGEGAERATLEGEVRRLGLTDRVVFTGYRSDIARAIAAFDVAVLTSLWEGLPRVLVQYSLLERPIVTFECEGAREIVDDGRNGFVVPSKDVDTLVDRLRRVVASAELRAEFGRLSRERVEGRWDVDLMVEAIAGIYEDVEAGRPPRETTAASTR
ncbi:MAG: glycosyltransferase family 4 protein [bacterium]